MKQDADQRGSQPEPGSKKLPFQPYSSKHTSQDKPDPPSYSDFSSQIITSNPSVPVSVGGSMPGSTGNVSPIEKRNHSINVKEKPSRSFAQAQNIVKVNSSNEVKKGSFKIRSSEQAQMALQIQESQQASSKSSQRDEINSQNKSKSLKIKQINNDGLLNNKTPAQLKFNQQKKQKSVKAKKNKKSGLMDLISRKTKHMMEDESELSHPSHSPATHGHSHGQGQSKPSHGHGHGHGPSKPSHGHGHGHSPKQGGVSDTSPINKRNSQTTDKQDSFSSKALMIDALRSENATDSNQVSDNKSPIVNQVLNNVKVADQAQGNLESPDLSSKSSLDSDHDSHATIEDDGHGHSHKVDQGGSQAQKDAQAELMFNILMNKMLKHCPTRLVQNEVFKFGTDDITNKNYESELGQTIEQLQLVLEKSKQVEKILMKEFEAKKHQNAVLISSNIVFNFEKMQENRQKMKEVELQTDVMVKDQRKLQKWLQNAIIQNEGQFVCHHKALVYERKSLGLFKYDTQFRKMVVWLTEWKYFDRFVIFLIILGSICQALDSQVDYSQNTEKTKLTKELLDQILEYSSYLFIMEALLKIISQGLIYHKNAYLRDGWNIVDFIVVLSSIFEIIVNRLENVNLPEVNYLRTFRVIRPLRSVKRIPSMRRLVTIMLRSLPELANTLVFMLFFFTVFGIVGVQTFHGVIYQRCRLTEQPVNGLWKMDPNQTDFICNMDKDTDNYCNAGTFCGSVVSYSLNNQENLDPLQDDPWSDEIILYNTVNFNNILYAICAIFEALTLEGWSIQMFMLMDTSSTNSSIAIFFYLILVVFGSYFVLNLILAVIMGSFTRFETQEFEQKMRAIEQEILRQVGQADSVVAIGDIPKEKSLTQESIQSQDTTPLKTSVFEKTDEKSKDSHSRGKPKLEFKLQPESIDDHLSKGDRTPKGSEGSAFSFSNKILAAQSQANNGSQANTSPKKQSSFEATVNSAADQLKEQVLLLPGSYTYKNNQQEPILNFNQGVRLVNTKQTELSISDDQSTQEQVKRVQSNILPQTIKTSQSKNESSFQEFTEQSNRDEFKVNYRGKSRQRNDRNLKQEPNSQVAQQSILEISDEDDYCIDYSEKKLNKKPYYQKNKSGAQIEFDNFMEGGNKVNETEDQMLQNRGPESFTELAMLNSQPKSQGFKDQNSQSPSIPLSSLSPNTHDENSNLEGNQTPSNRNEELGWSSMFTSAQRKPNKRARHKNKGLGSRITYALNGTIKMSSKRYAKSSIYRFFGQICSNKYFNVLILLTIAMNTITLSMDRYPIDVQTANKLEEVNKISTWIFVGELVIKVLGLGIQAYARDSMNQFDAIVVIISIIEIILSNQQMKRHNLEGEDEVTHEENMSLTIFRGFRLLRVFRLFSKWKTFHKMIVKIGETLKDIITFFFLLLIIVFVFSLLGVELFKNKAKINRFNDIVDAKDPLGYSPRQNFDDFLNAFVSVFVCLIGEDWQLIMHDYVRASKSMSVQTYFIILMIIGNLFLMNLFLAILLKNFEDKKEKQDEEADEKEEEEDILNINYLQKSLRLQFRRVFFKKEVQPAPQKRKRGSDKDNSRDKSISQSDMEEVTGKHPKVAEFPGDEIKVGPQIEIERSTSKYKVDKTQNESHSAEMDLEGGEIALTKQRSSHSERALSDSKSFNLNDSNVSKNSKASQDSNQKGRLSVSMKNRIAKSTINVLQKKRRASKQQTKLIETGKVLKLTGRSLYIFAQDNPCRVALAKLVVHQFFELFIFFIVLLSAVLMMADGPLQDPNHQLKPFIDTCNLVITVIFMAELLLKVIAMGFILHQHSYMRDGWNVLDFVIVAFSIASLIVESNSDGSNNKSAKTLELFKMLRVLRSLRMISKSEGLKLSVLSLIYSMPGILNVAIVSLLFLILLGIFFLNLFKGKFHYCELTEDIDAVLRMTQIANQFDCVNYGGTWKNSDINFDSIGEALTALFVMCTTEGWVVFMNQANDSMGIGIQPKRNANPVYQYVFIVYMIFGSLFITNLFIEVVINTFDQEKKAIDRNDRLTKFQKEWIQLQLKCYDVSPEAKINTNFVLRTYSIKIVENKYFDPFIMAMILLNAITLAMIWVGMSKEWLNYLEFFSDIFNYIFIIECALKLIAYQKVYFNNGWNIFDFTIVVFGIWGLLRQNASQQISILRILRVGRLLRLLKRAKRLYIIFNSFISTIPAFLNVGGLILVIIFIASVLGQRFFADVMISGSLDKYRNFQTPRNSLITLILVMTGEGWYELMANLGRKREIDFPCQIDPTYDDYANNDFNTVGCGKPLAKPFFIVYVIFVSLILVNLFIAVTLQGFNDVSSRDSCRITDMQIQLFINVWKEIDPDGTGYIHISEAASLMRNLIEKKSDLFPEGAKDLVYDPIHLQNLIEHLQLKLYKKFQYYNFHDILISLSQLYLQQLANNELDEIFEEFKQTHQDCFEAEDLDDVIDKIDEIMKEQNVQLCKKLEKTLNNFKNNVLGKIDRFEGNIYNSSMIPIVIKIQQMFREKRRARALIEAEQAKLKKFMRKNLKKEVTIEKMDLSNSEDENSDLETYVKKRDKISKKIKKKLDDIIHGNNHAHCDGGMSLQEMINKQGEYKKIIKKKELEREMNGRIINVTNSREDFAFLEEEKQETLEELLQIRDKPPRPLIGIELQTIKLSNYTRLEADEIKEAINTFIEQKKLKKESDAQEMQAQQIDTDIKPKRKSTKILNIRSAEVGISSSESVSAKSIVQDKFEKEHPKLTIIKNGNSSNKEIDDLDNNVFPKMIMKSDLKPFQNYGHISRQEQNYQKNTFQNNSFDYRDQAHMSSNQYSSIQSMDGQINGLFEQDQLQIPGKPNFGFQGSHKNLYGSNKSKKSKESQELIDSRRNPVTDDVSPNTETNQEQIDSFSRANVQNETSQGPQQQQTHDNMNLNIDTNQIQSRQTNQLDQQQSTQTTSLRRKQGQASQYPHKMRGGQPSQPKKTQTQQIQRSGQETAPVLTRVVREIGGPADSRVLQSSLVEQHQSRESSRSNEVISTDLNRVDLMTIDEQATLERMQSPEVSLYPTQDIQVNQFNHESSGAGETAIRPSNQRNEEQERRFLGIQEEQDNLIHQQSANFGEPTDLDQLEK